MPHPVHQFDIVVVGAGLAGAAFAAALRGSRHSLAVVEARPPAPASENWDARIYALSPANERMLSGIGAWQHLDHTRITPVHDMEIHGDAGGRLDFSAYETGVDALAWIAESGLLQRELWEHIKRQANVTLYCPAQPQALSIDEAGAHLGLGDGRKLRARLVVAADGIHSWVRERCGIAATVGAYGEMGVVANLRAAAPHRNTAFQWFRPDGVLAWLPLPEGMVSMVWSTPDEHARSLCALPPEALAARVGAAGGERLGAMTLVTPPQAFALRLMRVERMIAPRVALIGDAAHAIHPLSGHGINLGFQDAACLAQVLDAAPTHRDIGETGVLRAFERARAEEILALQAMTHGLQRLFCASQTGVATLRNLGLNLTNRAAVVRNLLARYAMG